MIISISGSQGAGKTTLINAIKDRLGDTVKVMERKTARSVLHDWGITLDDVYADTSLMKRFQEELVSRKRQDEQECLKEDPNAIWIVERTYADLFAYTTVYAGKQNDMSDWLDNYYDACKGGQAIYDHVFYLRGGLFPIQDDGLRPKNKHYGEMVDMFLKHKTQEMLPEMTPFIDIDRKDLDERVQIVIDKLTGNKNV